MHRRKFLRQAGGIAALAQMRPLAVTAVAGRTLSSLPPWVPAPGGFNVVGSNMMGDCDPCPNNRCIYSTGNGIFGCYLPWCTSIYADDFAQYGAYIHGPGGGHGAYNGNETYAFSMTDATQQWRRLYDPSTNIDTPQDWWKLPSEPNGGQASGHGSGYAQETGFYPDGKPCATHTFQLQVYIPGSAWGNAKGCAMQAVVAGGGDNNGCYCKRSAFLDLDTLTWSSSANHITRSDASYAPNTSPMVYYGAAVYDAQRNRVWYVAKGANTNYNTWSMQIQYMDVPTRTWHSQKITSIGPGGNSAADGVVGIYPDANLLIRWGPDGYDPINNSPYAYDVRNYVSRALTTTGPVPRETTGMEWCPPKGKFYCYPYHGTRCYTLTPPEADAINGRWLWGVEEFAGTGSPMSRNHDWQEHNARFNAFRWSNKLQCFTWWDDHMKRGINLFRPAGL